MKKKILAVAMAAMMVLGLAACGGADDQDGTEKGSSSSGKSEYKIGLVTDTGGVEDQSFNQSAWEGLKKAEKELGVTVNYLQSSSDADYTPNIQSFLDEDYDLIISVGYLLADATREAAEDNPDTNFAIIDDSTCADLDNVACLTFRQEQASYLVGYVAGKMTESNNVGFVLGMASDTMHLFGYGYCAGVIDANPDCKIQMANANSYSDSATGASLTNTFVTNGADVVFHAAGATGTGVISKCEELGVYAIGVDSDQNYLAKDTVITSAMKRVDVAVYDTVENLVNGSFKGGEISYNLTNDGVGIAPTTDLLSDELVAEIESIQEKIANGEITVPSNQEEFEAAYGDVYILD